MVTLEKNADGELDVRVLVPIQRHELLIRLFKELPVDESFTFINDHDPIPLFYEFRSIYGDVVGWDYLNRGGREWKVKGTGVHPARPAQSRQNRMEANCVPSLWDDGTQYQHGLNFHRGSD